MKKYGAIAVIFLVRIGNVYAMNDMHDISSTSAACVSNTEHGEISRRCLIEDARALYGTIMELITARTERATLLPEFKKYVIPGSHDFSFGFNSFEPERLTFLLSIFHSELTTVSQDELDTLYTMKKEVAAELQAARTDVAMMTQEIKLVRTEKTFIASEILDVG